MIKIVITFLVLFAVFHVGIQLLTQLNHSEAMSLTKSIRYSTMCASLAIVLMSLIVILF